MQFIPSQGVVVYPSQSTRFHTHLLQMLRAAALVLGMAFAMPAQPAHAGPPCARGDCVLACDLRLRQCSMYSLRELKPRLVVVEFMPYGYTRVYSNSQCERLVCTRRALSCSPLP
jgi:hypothetical protein